MAAATIRYGLQVLWNLLEAARRWQQDDAGLLAAGVAYYATVSLFPLLLVLIAGVGMFLRFTHLGQNSEQQVLAAVAQATSYDVSFQVAAAFQQVEREALWSGPLGAVGLLSVAVAVFCQFDQALDKIWKIQRPAADSHLAIARRLLAQRVKAFVVLLCLGFVVVLIFAAGLTLEALRQFSSQRFQVAEQVWRVAEATLGVILNTLVFTAIFRWLSKVPVEWLHAARGGLLSAVTWEVGRWVLAAFLIGGRYSAYGVVGSVLAAMLWIYYANSVLFLGAEYVQVIREQSQQRKLHVGLKEGFRRRATSLGKARADKLWEDRWSAWIASRRAA